MSQHSQYTFRPIVDNGDGESNATATTKFDKGVGSIRDLQSNADTLKHSSVVIDEVIESIDRLIYKGKLKDIATLNGLKDTLSTIGRSIERSAVSLSPIPSISYAYSRKQSKER